jgi:tetratricopeptide (TPR) repeat protein
VGSAAALADLERARAIGDALAHSPQYTWLMNGLGWTYFSRGDFAQAASQGFAMTLRAEREHDALLELCAANLMGATRAYSGHLDEALDWLDRAAAMLDVTEREAATVRSIVDLATSVRVYRAQVLAHRGVDAGARHEADQALARARRLGQPMSLCLALRCRALLSIRHDDPEAVAAVADELSAIVADHGVAQSSGPSRWYRGWILARSGDCEAGLRLVRDGLASHLQLGMATGCALAYGYAAEICLWQGDAASARESLASGLALSEQCGESLDRPRLLQLLARAEDALGNTQAARVSAQRARSAAAAIGAA